MHQVITGQFRIFFLLGLGLERKLLAERFLLFMFFVIFSIVVSTELARGHCRYGRVMPYDDEAGTTTRQRKSNSKKRVIQTQTSPAHKRNEPPTSTLLSEQARHPPAVFVTDATPMTSPRERTPTPGSLPGSIVDENEWASPYPEPAPSVSGPKTSRKKPVTVERVSVTDSRGAVTPSAVNVADSQLKDSRSPQDTPRTNRDISEMLPDVNNSKNTSPG